MIVIWGDWDFTVYRMDGDWTEVGGLYVFARRETDYSGNSLWRALYVGQTHNFADRLPTHPRWQEAQQLGATHVHARTEENAVRRVEVEAALIFSLQPPLNVQLR